MNLTLVRIAYLKQCVLGELHVGDSKFATLERPWIVNPAGKGGMPEQSCVPDGDYMLRPHTSDRFPDTYALINTTLGVYYQELPAGQNWGRTAILIHQGNWVRNVIGCIAIGMSHAYLKGENGVLHSRIALSLLREQLGKTIHNLTIRHTWGTSEPL